MPLSRILIFVVASQNSLVNLEVTFATTHVRCRKHAKHLIECDIKEIPFLRALISYIKDMKLTVRIRGGHTHITETVDWDSLKGDVSRFIQMSQDYMN